MLDRMGRVIVNLILIFYITASTIATTHIHKEGISNTDCKICIVIKNLHSADTPSPDQNLIVPCFYEKQISFTKRVFYYLNIKGFFAKAPPSLS